MTNEELKDGLRKYKVPEELLDNLSDEKCEALIKLAEGHPRGVELGLNMAAIMLMLAASGFDKEDSVKIMGEVIKNGKDIVEGGDIDGDLDWIIKKRRLGID